jgi:hypothetical protein|tara:strand:+ start:257 stop:658 length:402 start_codon:yes stop_codon:yes gene_type:complete
MTITRYEYETFELADCITLVSRYKKICEDYTANQGGPPYTEMKNQMEKQYTPAELAPTDADEREYWIQTLGRAAGIQLITTSRVDHNTMSRMSCLDDDGFDQAIRLCTQVAGDIDKKVKKAEKASKQHSAGIL